MSVRENPDIIRNSVKAVSYLSMNYDFVNQPISLDILRNLMPLLDMFHNDPANSKHIANLIFSISNIVKGDPANKRYFFEQGGCSRFLTYILEQNTPASSSHSLGVYINTQHDLKVIDLCLESIKEVASFK